MAANSAEQGLHMSAHWRHGTLEEGPTVIGSRVVGAVKSTIITFILLSGTHLRYNRS